MRVSIIYSKERASWAEPIILFLAGVLRDNLKEVVEVEELPSHEVLDDLEGHLPRLSSNCDLLLYLGFSPEYNLMAPQIANLYGCKALVIPVDDPDLMPPAVEKEISEKCSESDVGFASPRPCCSLEPVGIKEVDELAELVGKPKIIIRTEGGVVQEAKCLRSAPCGSTAKLTPLLRGKDVEGLDKYAGLRAHSLFCKASMKRDPLLGETSMHAAAYQVVNAVREALNLPPERWKGKLRFWSTR